MRANGDEIPHQDARNDEGAGYLARPSWFQVILVIAAATQSLLEATTSIVIVPRPVILRTIFR